VHGNSNLIAQTRARRSVTACAAPWIAAVALLWCVCQGAIRAADPQPDADREAVEALRVGLDRWERSVEFRCAFRFRETFVPRLEDAKQGKFSDAPEPKGGVNARGILCKKGNLVRLRLDYGQPPKPVDAPPGGNLPGTHVWTNASYDECSNGEVVAAYNFPHGNRDPFNEIYFSELRPHPPQVELRPCLGGWNAVGQLNPLNPLCNARGRPLEPWDYGDAVQSDSATVKVTSPQRRQVHLRRVSSYGTQERWVTIRVESERPVVEQILEVVKDATGKETAHTEIVMRKFVRCPGGQVPSEIVHVTRNSNGLVDVRLWSSDDLGARPVKDEDFIIETAPKVLVIGLAGPRVGPNRKQQFDMNRIRLGDLEIKRNNMRRLIRLGLGLPP
jgi:hypothetical protein